MPARQGNLAIELAAQDMPVKNWARYSPCSEDPDVSASQRKVGPNYEELISYLDSVRDADAIKKADPKAKARSFQ